MSNRGIRNIGASVRVRLLQLARKQGEDFQLMLTRYALERLLYRLSRSSYADRFVLKERCYFRFGVTRHTAPLATRTS